MNLDGDMGDSGASTLLSLVTVNLPALTITGRLIMVGLLYFDGRGQVCTDEVRPVGNFEVSRADAEFERLHSSWGDGGI